MADETAVAAPEPEQPEERQTTVAERALSIEERRWHHCAKLAAAVYRAGMAPESHRSAQQTAIVMLTGHEYGFEPMQSCKLLYVIGNKASLTTEGMAALVYGRGLGSFQIEEGKDTVTVTGTRKDGGTFSSTWTAKRVEQAGLAGQGPHRKYPEIMRRWRAMAEVCRVLFPDVAWGAYSPDELTAMTELVPGVAESRTDAIKAAIGAKPLPEPEIAASEATDAPEADAPTEPISGPISDDEIPE